MIRSLFFCVCLIASASFATAQIKTPAPSPLSKVMQHVGLTEVTVEYSRPLAKGRKLFVDVESFGSIWRTGANAATTITFSDDVKVEGKEVPAGTYAIYSIPDQNEWTVMLYKDTKLGGRVNKYDEGQELTRFKVKTQKSPMHFEAFTFHFDNMKYNSATLAMAWGTYYIPFTIEAMVDERVKKNIDAVLGGPSARDYYVAASYYLSTGKDLKQAHEWAAKANEMSPKFWQMRTEALILGKMGKYQDAIAKAKESTAMAEKEGNKGYPKMNAQSISEWTTAMKSKKPVSDMK